MLSFHGLIWVTRGEEKPLAGKWRAKGKKYRTGAYTLAILRGEHPDEPEMAVFDHLTIERIADGAEITLALTAEQIAAAQGPARPEIEHLVYRLRHHGAEVYSGLFSVHPRSSQVEAPRKLGDG
ncbi:hypothetical protein [Sphingopyxis sp. RIFCSPHIGHO2_12_FULL_65_19]|uniref:hypothetical protein n=1 Tax=Sphingopyxis sp. RIFCSPHIGHO2_12_FULL_65_19 TaxID=1802172 RepID=UPI0008B71BDB|nr:hypothetical protein [Sphingopyxis sp. RIFCSPHIGHO2_12_FULL_65_19]OHD07562.1 MAG: hypothetical protein A3E77_09270 [Sphingopyxis sp. RIFCSPHIGHO2_12_FULL_65_19]